MLAESASPPSLAAGRPAEAQDLLLQRRYRLVRPWLNEASGVLLDFGCGNGSQTLLLRPHFGQVLGLDIDRKYLVAFLDAARMLNSPRGVWGVQCDGSVLPCRDRSVDFLVSFEVLEHVRDDGAALAEMWRVLKPGGTLALSVPNRWWLFETHGANLPLLRWNRVPFFSWLPRSLHDRWARARIYRRREIVRRLADVGFVIMSASYVTAPMDVVRWRPLQTLLRATLFGRDRTRIPFLATACLIVASRPNSSSMG